MDKVLLHTATVERVTDALQSLINCLDHGKPHITVPGEQFVAQGRAALRELATMTSAGTALAEEQDARLRLLTEALNAISGRAIAAVQALQIAPETDGNITLHPAEPRFMTARMLSVNAADSPATFGTLAEYLHDNYGDNEEFCDWLRDAKVGESFFNGGGAAPDFLTWRVS